MNTNRNNNRRRGRGNNRGSGGGGNQGNRIDSRARGNAPQLLEKYRKLAHDASMNDDRVQTEYYLQFADHYFRVLADSRSQKDEGRPRRDFEREQAEDDDQDDDFEDVGRERSFRDRPQDRPERQERAQDRPERQERQERHQDSRNRNGEEAPVEEGSRGLEGEQEGEEEANPFIRDTRARRQRSRSRAKPAGERNEAEAEVAESDERGEPGVDPAVLPPSIGRREEEPAQEEQPARPRATRGRPRRARPADNGDAEALEAVS